MSRFKNVDQQNSHSMSWSFNYEQSTSLMAATRTETTHEPISSIATGTDDLPLQCLK